MPKRTLDLTMNELKILSALYGQDRYGLEIVETIKESGGNLFLGSLYNIASRLEKKGFIESYWGDENSDRGGNRRKYFKITGKGQQAVSEAQSTFASLWNFSIA